MKTLPINNQGPDLYELCRKKSCVNITHQYYVLNTVERYTIVTSLCVYVVFVHIWRLEKSQETWHHSTQLQMIP